MDYATPAQQACHERVTGQMKELFGEMAAARTDIPAFSLRMGSVVVQAFIDSLGDTDAIVTVRAWLVTGAELTADLMKHLLEQNYNVRFGAFGIDEVGDIFFQHAILGTSIDKDELRRSIMAVSYSGDEADDQIVARFGGTRFVDRTAPTPPPTPDAPPAATPPAS